MNELIIISLSLLVYYVSKEQVYYPDSIRYTSDKQQHYPFNLRLIKIPFPTVLFLPLITYYYLIPFTSQALWGALLVTGLSGVYVQNIKGYRLIDGTALCFGLLSAIFFNHDLLIPAFIFLILASATKETMAVFVALYSFSFLPLVGLVIPLIIYIASPPSKIDIMGSKAQRLLDNPFNAFKEFHRKNLMSPIYFLSWGICITAVFYTGQYWQWILAGVVIGYLQLLVATDRVRLFQYSFPLVLIATLNVIEMNIFFLLIHLFNPYFYIEKGWTEKEFDEIKQKVK